MTIRILIVDDQDLVRTGFRLFLQTQEASRSSARRATARRRSPRPRAAARRRPDGHPDAAHGRRRGDARLRGAIEPPPRVLVLTTFDLDEYVFGALRAGAAGFLLKDAPRERLVEAIRVVHGGEALLSPSITRRLIEDFAARSDPLEPAGGAARRS